MRHNFASIGVAAARAPNARGMVEYVTNVEILKPADIARGNRVLFFEFANRGNKTALAVFDDGIPGRPSSMP